MRFSLANVFNNFSHRRGLTLLELVVAVSLFAVLTLVAVRIFTKIIDIQDRTKDEQNLEGDLRYAMGVFSDEVQRATLHAGPPDSVCGGAGCGSVYFCLNSTSDLLYIRDKNNTCVLYYLSNNKLVAERGGTTYAITSDDITVNNLKFFVSTAQDRVLVHLSAVGASDFNKTISYQTTVTNTTLRN